MLTQFRKDLAQYFPTKHFLRQCLYELYDKLVRCILLGACTITRSAGVQNHAIATQARLSQNNNTTL